MEPTRYDSVGCGEENFSSPEECCFLFGNNIAVYPDVSVILKRSSPPEGAKGNAVKDPAQGLSKRLCEILRVAQDDTNAEKLKNWVNSYIITFFF